MRKSYPKDELDHLGKQLTEMGAVPNSIVLADYRPWAYSCEITVLVNLGIWVLAYALAVPNIKC